MKVRNIAIAALIAIGTSASAFAATDADALRRSLDSNLIKQGYLDVTVNNGVATIFGYAHAVDIAKARRLAQLDEGIDHVVINATFIN